MRGGKGGRVEGREIVREGEREVGRKREGWKEGEREEGERERQRYLLCAPGQIPLSADESYKNINNKITSV